MKEEIFHEVLRVLIQVREDLSHDARDRAADRVDELIERLAQAHAEGELGHLSNREVLDAISKIIAGTGQIAALIDTILGSL